MKFKKIYLEKKDTVNKFDYDLLYEEYLKVSDKHKKLERQCSFVTKYSDRELSKNMTALEKHKKINKRFESILKQGDRQGKTLLTKTYSLKEQLDLELEYELELIKEIADTQKEVVLTMGAIGEFRSKETGNHVKRVAEYSKLLALYYGLDKEDAELLKEASPMHDIGKVGISDSILNKPGRLSSEEWRIMQTHSELGHEMLKHSKRTILKTAAIVAIEHHEKWDGSGYPNALQGNDIHIYGRITALADVFDALGSDRCYKKAWSDESIFQFFRDEKGKHFDPTLVDIFLDNIDEFLLIKNKFKDNCSRIVFT